MGMRALQRSSRDTISPDSMGSSPHSPPVDNEVDIQDSQTAAMCLASRRQTQHLLGMAGLVNQLKLLDGGAPPNTPQPQYDQPFWRLPGRPPRQTLPSRFPFSTHQPLVAQFDGQDNHGSPSHLHSLAISNAPSLHSNQESETMPPWDPHRKPRVSDDGIPAMISAAPGPSLTPGQFVASQGDALLLNTMDHQRSSTQEWMQRATVVSPGMWDTTAGENAEHLSSGAMSPMSIDTTWGPEGVDEENPEAGMDDGC